MKNNLYTKSYFCKRLRDKNFIIQSVIDYPIDDIRYWTLIISPNEYNILCTCYKINSKEMT